MKCAEGNIGCENLRERRGFTLIELMMVLAIIGILMALLLPAVARAKARAQRIDCISRLKQWNVAFRLFPEENEGLIARECYEPLGEVTINNWSQVRGRTHSDGTSDSDDVWYNALPPYLSQLPTVKYIALTQRRKFFDTRLLIHCSAARFPSDALFPLNQFPLFSMAMNSQLIRGGPTVPFALLENRDPARMVTFLDNRLEGEPMVHERQETSNLGQPGAYANRFGARHENGGNLAFVDGHVAWFPGPEVVETREGNSNVGSQILPPRDIVWELFPY